MPMFLHDVLQQLNWDNGTRIPISNEENKFLEDQLSARNKELEKLREETQAQNVRENELIFHKKTIQYEHQENMQLLAVQKMQLENEENFSTLCSAEISKFNQDIVSIEKQSKDINTRVDATHGDLARVLRRVEFYRNALGGEQGSLNEWKAALQRSEADVNTISSFNKEDKSKIHELEVKRQNLKKECCKKHIVLSQMFKDLMAEENRAERISNQVLESLNQRQNIVSTWTGAVENLRQRDREIQQMKNELCEMKLYNKNRIDYANEKFDFLNTHINNNAETEGEYKDYNNKLSKHRQQLKFLQETLKSLESEELCSKKELISISDELSYLRSKNKQLNKDLINKDDALANLKHQIATYKEKLAEMMDSSKTAIHRMKQLQDMFENEEKYLKQITSENERILYAILQSRQMLSSLKDEENNLITDIKGYKATISNINGNMKKMTKELIKIKEKLHDMTFEYAMLMKRLAKLEGEPADVPDYDLFEQRSKQLELVLKEKMAVIGLLQNQLTKLEGELRLIHRNIENKKMKNELLQNNFQEITAQIEGAQREERNHRKSSKDSRIEESILRLKINHAQASLQQISNKTDTLARGHLDLNAAMQERIVEANERKNLFGVQKNVLIKERGGLAAQIKIEENRVDQFKKRYDINICLLGKDEMGDAYSVAYFKIKHLQEKSELQQEGDSLDAEIKKGEQEIAALEATLKVVDAANRQLVRSLDTIKANDPEMLEYTSLCEDYDNCRLIRSKIVIEARQESKRKDNLLNEIEQCAQHIEEIESIRENLMDEYMGLQKELKEQREKLIRADELRKKSATSIRRKIKSSEIYKIHEKDFQAKIILEANRSAGAQLRSIDSANVERRLTEEGLDVAHVYSGPSASRITGFYSTKSSIVSSKGSTTHRTYTESISEYSVDESDSSAIRFRENLKSDQSSDYSIRDDKIKGRFASKTTGNKLPVSVIVFGEESSNDGTVARNNLPSTSNLFQKSKYTKQPKAP